MHFIHKIQCFEVFLHKIALFFKKNFFPEFRSIELVFRSIKITIKIFGQLLFVSINARLILDQVTTLETPLLSQQVVTSKGIPSALPTYS